MLPKPLLLALAFRAISLLFPQTFFQPDEYWQSLEPAHEYVFGYGFLTWEWRDLPAGGRLRGWIWPGVFVIIYRFLQITGLDDTKLIVLLPRMVGVIVAAVTDWATYRLSYKLLGPGSAAGAFFLSITSIFHAHALTRSLSNSPETMLTALALVYFPFAPLSPSSDPLQGGRQSIKSVAPVIDQLSDKSSKSDSELSKLIQDKQEDPAPPVLLQELNYVAMDRAGPTFDEKEAVQESFSLAVLFASIAICIRPTTAVLWVYLGIEYLFRMYGGQNPGQVVRDLVKGGVTATMVLVCSILIDYHFTGKFYFALWNFVAVNMHISAVFGATSPLYHLTQSLPILLFPIWYWWGQGFIACLLPKRYLPSKLESLDAPEGMRSLARGITFAVFILSSSPHSEWRFIHPFLPSLLLFALPPLYRNYVPTVIGAYLFRDSLRQYIRFPKRAFYLILLAPIIPYVYLDVFHDRAPVEVMSVLRHGELGNVTGIAMVMDCYWTPWMSHLHRDVPYWRLGCEPPVDRNIDRETYFDERQLFFQAPLTSFDEHMEAYAAQYGPIGNLRPSHVVSFDAVLNMGETETGTGGPTIKDSLRSMGYREVWYKWSPSDLFHPEHHSRGGLRVWSTDTTVKPIS